MRHRDVPAPMTVWCRRRFLLPGAVAAVTLGLLGSPSPMPPAEAEAYPEIFTTFTSEQGGADAGLGIDVAADGNFAVVGAPGADNGRGMAYVYQFNPDRSIFRVARLSASDGQAGDRFGYSVAIDGSTIVVGAYADNADAGAAYVFTRPGAGWLGVFTETAKLTAPDSAMLGYSVAVSGGTVVAGDYRYDGVRGAVRVYDRPLIGWQDDSTPTRTMRASDARANDQLGKSVAISGNTIVAGAEGSNGRGASYVFVRAFGVLGQWPVTQTAKLTTSSGQAGDDIGATVDVDGSTVAVGAPWWGTDGAAFVYSRPVDGWQDTTQTARLTAPGDHPNATTGIGVDVDGPTILVGAGGIGQRGGVMKFAKPDAGWATTDQTAWQITPSGNALERLGSSVAANGDYVMIGWPQAQLAAGGGALLVYGFPGFSSVPLRVSFPDTEVGASAAGKSVTVTNPGSAALLPATALTGADRRDFTITANTCTPVVFPTASCTVSMTFTPTAAGGRNAFLQFTDDADGSPHRIPLTGTGIGGPGPNPDPDPTDGPNPNPTEGPNPGPDPNPGARPAPPSGLKVTAKRTKVTATWRAGAGAADYRVAVRGKKPKLARTTTTSALRQTVKSLKPGKRYRVCVRSHNGAGNSTKICRKTRTKR